MAVAVKTTDARSPGATTSIQVLSLVGLVFLIASLAAILWAIPTYVPQLLAGAGVAMPPYLQGTVVVGVMLLAAVVLIYLGRGIIGTKVVGVRAGIFTAFVGLLTILLVGTWFGGYMEWLAFDKQWFNKTVGWIISAVFAALLVLWFLRWFFAKGTDKWLREFEEGGWFSATSYKPQQGVRVRRGTVIGLLLLGGAGVYTLVASNGLAQYGQRTLAATATEEERAVEARRPPQFNGWSVGIPFTDTLTLWPPTPGERKRGETGPFGDATEPRFTIEFDPKNPREVTRTEQDPLLIEQFNYTGPGPLVTTRWDLRDRVNHHLRRSEYVYLRLEQEKDGLVRGIVPKAQFQELLQALRDNNYKPAIDDSPEARDTRDPIPAGNPAGRKEWDERLYQTGPGNMVTLNYVSVPLLPHVQFTVPLLLLALTLWMAWRLTNYPPFADFLIATEAEMNKVSWTTRKRLFQDTIVVLVTLFLMAGFLLIVDLTCRNVLSHRWVNVIQLPPDGADQKNAGPKPW